MPNGSGTLAGGVNRVFTNYNRPAQVENHYVIGSGVGGRNIAVRRALRRRASNNAEGKPCCMPRPPPRNPPRTYYQFAPYQLWRDFNVIHYTK